MATPSDPQCEGPTPSSSTSTLVGSTTDTRTPKRHHRQRSSVSVKKRASTQQAPALVAETADYFDTAAISPLGASPEQHAGLGLHGVEMEAHGRVSAPESRRGPRIDTKQLGVSLQDDAPAPSPTTRRELDFDAGTSETEGDEERAISSGSYPAGKAVSDGPALPSSSDNVRTPTSSELTQTTSAPKPSISEEQSGSSDSPPPLPAKDIGPISPPIPVKDAPSRTESPARMRLNGTPKSTLASPTHTSPLYQWTERPAPASPSSLSQTPRTSSLLLRTRAGSLLGSQASGSGEGRSGSGAAHANASSSPGRPGPGEVPSRIVPLRRNTGGALGPGTPTRGKRMSLSYIPSPSTSVGSPPVGSPPATSPSIASGASSYFPSRIDASSDVRAAHMRWPSLSRGSGSAGASTPSRLSLVQTPQSAPLGSGYFPPQQGTNDCPKSAGFAERARRPREDGETVMSTHRELLSSIAEKERRCLELREGECLALLVVPRLVLPRAMLTQPHNAVRTAKARSGA